VSARLPAPALRAAPAAWTRDLFFVATAGF